jgi:hypothetical protein
MLAPLAAVLVRADRKLDIGERDGTGFPAALEWIVLGADIANREFD